MTGQGYPLLVAGGLNYDACVCGVYLSDSLGYRSVNCGHKKPASRAGKVLRGGGRVRCYRIGSG
ncbi:conserved protein of unknown function [Pseudomonas marincola]|uniref:Uncharacterized protein n=1 Tax=Pseudomonas marincola TaxID=437900 RepID=A0A653E5T1_9PSED|nr:conserved protein of unknown function [Pseudomonas marincola]